MTDWARILRAVSPRAKSAVVNGLAPHLDDFFAKYKINTLLRQAHFLAQAAHESAHFTTLEEIGGPSYFARYDGRKDLGNVKPGDGNRFHGRGIFQLTGRANYREMGKKLGLPLEQAPQLAADPENSLAIAGVYWNSRSISKLADKDDVRAVTKKINGGYNGIADRIDKLARAKKALGIGGARGLLDGEDDESYDSRHGIDAPIEPVAALVEQDEPEPAFTKEQIYKIQCQLRQLHYYDVGDADGDLGDFTKTAIYAFRLANDLPPGHEIDDDFLKALAIAPPRPISEKRAEASSREVAEKVPEVKASLSARLWSGVQAVGASAAAGVAGFKAFVEDYIDQFSPYRTAIGKFASSIPPSVVFLAFALLAGVSVWIWWKSRRAVNKGTEAYQMGARK